MNNFSPDITDDYYSILGINKNCNEGIIKKSYRNLARKYHPDKNINCPQQIKIQNEEKLKIINEAYNILSDKTKRDIYDKYGKIGLENIGKNNNMFDDKIYSNVYNFFKDNDNFIKINGININIKNNLSKKIDKKTLIPINTFIKIKNLSNSKFNFNIGKIIDYKINEYNNSIRYIIELLEFNYKKISIKEENFQQIIKVKINNLVNFIELNNEYGDIIDYNNSTKKYKIVIDDDIYYLKSENFIIPNNTSVKIIKFEKKLIGLRGIILSYNKFNKEYELKLNDKIIIKINCYDIIV